MEAKLNGDICFFSGLSPAAEQSKSKNASDISNINKDSDVGIFQISELFGLSHYDYSCIDI
jgi:hypothetical protein